MKDENMRKLAVVLSALIANSAVEAAGTAHDRGDAGPRRHPLQSRAARRMVVDFPPLAVTRRLMEGLLDGTIVPPSVASPSRADS